MMPDIVAPYVKFYIFTPTPDAYPGTLGVSVMKRAIEHRLIDVHIINLHDFTTPSVRLDDTPFGGGPGMVLRADTVHRSLCSLPQEVRAKGQFIAFAPRGRFLTQGYLNQWAQRISHLRKTSESYNHPHWPQHDVATQHIILLCPRYEGVDERLLHFWGFYELSIGPFVCCGGDVAAMMFIESLGRLLPGVVGAAQSIQYESFQELLCDSSVESDSSRHIREYGHYTRPAIFQNIPVPKVLQSGHHKDIAHWRMQQSLYMTYKS